MPLFLCLPTLRPPTPFVRIDGSDGPSGIVTRAARYGCAPLRSSQPGCDVGGSPLREHPIAERTAQTPRIARPASTHVRAVFHDEGRAIVGLAAPGKQVDRPPLEPGARALHLGLHPRAPRRGPRGRWPPPGGSARRTSRTCAWINALSRYGRMPCACPPDNQSPSNGSASMSAQTQGRAVRGILPHRGVQGLGVLLRAQLTEHHPGEQEGIGGGHGAALGGEHDLDARGAQQVPRHRDLGRVEVEVGEREDDAGHRPPRGRTRPTSRRCCWSRHTRSSRPRGRPSPRSRTYRCRRVRG